VRGMLGRVFRRGLCTSGSAQEAEIELLHKLLKASQARLAAAQNPVADDDAGNGKKFQIQTFNAISPVGLKTFPSKAFAMTGSSGAAPDGNDEPHAILLRSHKLQVDEVSKTVRAIARCGAGTNNIPIDEMTKRGIPVFNTPGANANSVKELVLCGLLIASRGIIEGIEHVNEKIVKEETSHAAIAARIEKDKKHFGGQELLGKTLAVCGLGNIGAMVAEAGIALGMNVVGYDPKISVQAAWRLPNSVRPVDSLEAAFGAADYVSINMPYIKNATHHAINEAVLAQMKPSCHILNMARGEIVDGDALKRLYKKGHSGKYICDFADEFMQDHPKFVCIPTSAPRPTRPRTIAPRWLPIRSSTIWRQARSRTRSTSRPRSSIGRARRRRACASSTKMCPASSVTSPRSSARPASTSRSSSTPRATRSRTTSSTWRISPSRRGPPYRSRSSTLTPSSRRASSGRARPTRARAASTSRR